MVKVNFCVDAEKELKYLKTYLKICGKNKLTDSTLKLIELDEEIAKKEIIKSYDKKEFKLFVKSIKKEWEKIGNDYFDRIVKITGYNWNLEEYDCILTNNVPGFAVIPEKKVIVIGKEFKKGNEIINLSLESQLYVLAHELFHLHYFEVVRKEGLSMDAIKLNIVETVPVIVFFCDSELPKYWPSITLEKAKSSYKEVEGLYDYALTSWNKKKSYIDFIKDLVNHSSK